MTKLIYKLTTVFLFALLCGISFTSCEEDKYNKIDDLFQPRLVLTEQADMVKGNSITVVWYKVNDAVSYTVEVHRDNYYGSLFISRETTEPFVFLDDIPYGSTFFIRIRSNASDPVNNSQWTYTNATTEPRPEYAKLLEDVSKTEITESTAVVRWKVDPQNPVDSVSVMPMMSEAAFVSRYLTAEEQAQGYAVIEGLEKNTLYAANIYDTTKPRTYDKPYNQVTFRTAGPSIAAIHVGFEDDLTAILTTNNDDSEIAEGTEYFLPAGSYYKLNPFAIKKGFRLVGSSEGEKPIVLLDGSWNMASGAYISSVEFVNIEFRQETLNQYFCNINSSYTLENISMVNCDFIGIKRGFWRHQGANFKHIMNFEIEGCTFMNCGQPSSYGTFALDSGDNNDNVERVVIRNCTFCGQGETGGWGSLFSLPRQATPIHLEYKNVTFYNFCLGQRMIFMENAVGSEFIMEGIVLASASGLLYTIGANTSTTFSNNYTTTDYALGGSAMNATELPISAADLFVDPDKGDLTIKDSNSPIVINRAGDTRWIP